MEQTPDETLQQLTKAWPGLPWRVKLHITWLVWLNVQERRFKAMIKRIYAKEDL